MIMGKKTEYGDVFEDIMRLLDLNWGYEGMIVRNTVDKTDEGYQIKVVAPGIDKKDIEISYNNELLKVKLNYPEDKATPVPRSATWGVKNIDASRITAKLDSGMLYIDVPFDKKQNVKIKVS